MMVCPTCKVKLQKEQSLLICPECAFHPTEIDGILCFALDEIDEDFADYQAQGIEQLYKYEQNHFWFKNRRRVIRRIFKKYVEKSERIMEIGAGTGSVSQMLALEGYRPELGEIHVTGLQYAQKYGLNRLYQFDTRKVPFKEEYDTVCMFDVLEHIENDRLAVKNVHHMLKKGGKFIVTVPAHRFLWSTIDTVSGHKRRYGVKELKKMFINNGFEILEARHFFSFLIPFFLLRKWLNQKKEHSLHEVNPGLQINRLLNWTFNALLTLEYYLFSRFSPGFGGSILMVGRKTNHQEKIFYKASWCPGG